MEMKHSTGPIIISHFKRRHLHPGRTRTYENEDRIPRGPFQKSLEP